MYVIDFFKNLICKRNYGILVWLILNTVIVTAFLGSCIGEDFTSYLLGAAIYIVVLFVSLSPLGESILRWQNGCKPIRRIEDQERIMPIFNEVYEKARLRNPELPDDVRIYLTNSQEANAFATGRKTVCITRGILSYPDEQIKSVLAHEFGHLAHKDTDAILIICVGNLLVSAIFVAIRIVYKIVSAFFAFAFGFVSESFAGGFIAGFTRVVIDVLLALLMQAWTKFGALLCLHSSRQNENQADKYSYDLGYGNALCAFLDSLPPSTEKGLWATLNSSHPDHDDRISYLQSLGCTYRRGVAAK